MNFGDRFHYHQASNTAKQQFKNMKMATQSPPMKQAEALQERNSQIQEKPHKSAEMQVEEY